LFFGLLRLAGFSGVVFAGPPGAPEMDGALIGQVGVLMSGVVLIARLAKSKSKNK